ncbi:MAG: N-acetylglucosamine kinase [Telluria sp.]
MDEARPRLGLGIDAGGTRTRWALAQADGEIVAEGAVAGLSALQATSAGGREALRSTLEGLARELQAYGPPQHVRAGLTGFGSESRILADWLADIFKLPRSSITVGNDVEIAYLDSFEPGAGYLVYAGTGSIGAYIDAAGVFHRAGGRGVVLDDGGGGFWIAREALRHIWRAEDEAPGCWRGSPMACAVFDHVGGSDWSWSRQFIYGQERGEVGKLAVTIAAAAKDDPVALAILREAGIELARLANALIKRFGPRPVALSGRAAELHPIIGATVQAQLPADVPFRLASTRPHYAAARSAARGGAPTAA